MADPGRPAVLPVLAAFARRALVERTRQGAALVLQLGGFAIGLASQAFLGRFVDSGSNTQLGSYAGHYAAFLLVGVALLDLQHAIVTALSAQLRRAQVDGGLEALLVTPAPMPLLLLGVALPDAVAALLRMAVYAALGALAFGLRLSESNLGGAVAVLLLALAAFAALALLGGALTLFLRRADPLQVLIATTSLVAGGVLYPRGVLPAGLLRLGAVLPITPALDGMRAALIHGAGIRALAPALAQLAAFASLIGLLGAWLFSRALTRAREDGSLTAP